MGAFVVREVKDGRQGEPAITRERRRFSKIHESHCKPLSCLSCSLPYQRVEVIADLCSSMDRMNERQTKYQSSKFIIVALYGIIMTKTRTK